MADAKLFDKLTEIRKKLDKYSQTRDTLKIKGYLNELNCIENVNLEVLKRSEIVECLKSLKKKDDPDFSSKAEKLIKKWKNIVTSLAEKVNEENSKSSVKEEKRENSDKKRSFAERTEIAAKKPKLNGTSTIQAFSDKNLVNPSKNESEKSAIVPMPTARLEDIVSEEALPSNDLAPKFRFIPNGFKTSSSNLNTDNFNPLNQVDDDEALAKILKNKHSKRTLYTGRKTNATGSLLQPTKLFDLASKILIDNLDDLHLRISIYNNQSMFPVPFDLIKRILERASAKQLQSIEYYNPNLLSDTDELWKKLCEQEFKKVEVLDEDETWRELYYRKVDEREEKFRRARDLISKKQAEKPKERQTKEATVKFVATTARSSSTTLSQSAAASKLKAINSSSGPVRQIVHDSSDRRGGSASGPRKPAISTPAMSQGMRATMKLIKKTTSRR
ncbi:transcription elongation factor B polypeptide 3 [Brachionus plicatilis]|uniref:Elongin-A n=1 Tax=Brachionus plicatilis TaxID=10195 RepID=A0A3M7QP94_BRAPC|nr:transcription elongation factor B polypeptide 3 [Brachionus plicatilis]